MPGQDMTHRIRDEIPKLNAVIKPPNKEMFAPAAFIPKNLSLLTTVAVNSPSGIAAPN
jgi:hypothetical protein